MTKILFLFLTTAFGVLKILSPSNLVQLYDDGVVPSVTGNIDEFPINTQGTVVFIPKKDKCRENNWNSTYNFTVFVVEDISSPCRYDNYVYYAEKAGGIGVIFMMNVSNSQLKNFYIPTYASCNLFAVGISNMYISEWKKWDSIQVNFERDWINSEDPKLTIALSGNYSNDEKFMYEWYRYLMPYYPIEIKIELLFNYTYNCYNCSSIDCYSGNKYCIQ